MKLVALAVLLAVMQAAPSAPGKATDNSVQASPKIKNKSQSKQAPPLPSPPMPKTDGNGLSKSNGGDQHQENTEHTVGISKLPPVTVNTRRDWADWGTWGFNLLLVVVGALQVVLLCWTLRVIRRQATEMLRQRILMRQQWREMSAQTASLKEYVEETKKIAKSTADSVEMVVSKERARISVIVDEPNVDVAPAQVNFRLSCWGTTPAFIKDSRATVKISSSAEAPKLSPELPMGLPPILDPTEEHRIGRSALIWEKMKFTPDDIADLETGKLVLHFWGRIDYTDAFGNPRLTTFRCYYAVTDLKKADGRPWLYWRTYGSPEDNRET